MPTSDRANHIPPRHPGTTHRQPSQPSTRRASPTDGAHQQRRCTQGSDDIGSVRMRTVIRASVSVSASPQRRCRPVRRCERPVRYPAYVGRLDGGRRSDRCGNPPRSGAASQYRPRRTDCQPVLRRVDTDPGIVELLRYRPGLRRVDRGTHHDESMPRYQAGVEAVPDRSSGGPVRHPAYVGRPRCRARTRRIGAETHRGPGIFGRDHGVVSIAVVIAWMRPSWSHQGEGAVVTGRIPWCAP